MKKLAISISGGGMLGIGPLAYMAKVEKDYNISISDYAVAFAGTSTGAIIAGLLNEGRSATEIFDLYRANVKSIFTKYPWWKRWLPKVPTYDNRNLKKMLQENLSGSCSDWKKPIFIPATHMNGESVEKVWDLGDHVPKWFAVLTSTAAPTYFDVVVEGGQSYMDGGMWKNSPVSVLNAGLNRSAYRGDVKIMSFDTGLTTPNTAKGNMTWLGWLKYLKGDFIARSSRSGDYEVRADIGTSNVLLCSPSYYKKIPMDAVDNETIETVISLWTAYYNDTRLFLDEFMEK